MDTPPYTGPSAGPTSPPPPPFGSPAPRQLRRRPDEGPIAGVCAGVAEYFNVDPVIVRIAAVVLALTGPGIIAYALAWIFVPAAEGPSSRSVAGSADGRDRGAQIFGVVLLAVSVSILWGGWWSPARRWFFPLGLMMLGAWLLLRRDRDDDLDQPSVAPETPYPWSTPAPVAVTSPADPTGSEASIDTADAAGGEVDPPVTDPTLVDAASTDEETDDATTVLPTAPGGDSAPPWDRAPWGAGPPPEPPESVKAARRRRRLVFPIVMGALLLWTGIAFLAGVSLQSGLAVALCIVGIGFVLGAFVGGSKALIVPAVLVGAALVATSVVDVPLSGPVGSRTWTPQTIAQVEDHYELSIGEGILDLTELPLEEGDDVPIKATIGVGHLVVEVPDGVGLDITADASGGDIEILGRSSSGVGVGVERSVAGDPDAGTLELDLEVGLGHIEVIVVPTDRFDGQLPPSTTSTTLG